MSWQAFLEWWARSCPEILELAADKASETTRLLYFITATAKNIIKYFYLALVLNSIKWGFIMTDSVPYTVIYIKSMQRRLMWRNLLSITIGEIITAYGLLGL